MKAPFLIFKKRANTNRYAKILFLWTYYFAINIYLLNIYIVIKNDNVIIFEGRI